VLAYGLTTSAAVLVVLRLLGGAGEALFFVGMVTAFTDLAPAERRGEAMSLASLALYLGIGIGPLLAEAVAARYGLATFWVAAGAASLGAAALTAVVPETRPTASPVAAAASPARRWVHPAGLLPGFVLLASIVGMAGFLAFVPLHVLDVGLTSSGAVLLVFAGVVVLIRSVGARLPDLLGPGRAIRLALFASVVGLGCVAIWPSAAGLFLGAGVLGVGIALLTPSVFALAAEAAPVAERSQVMATTSAFIDIAFGLGPAVMGLVAAAYGRPAVFVAGAVAAGGGLALVHVARLGRPAAIPVPSASLATAQQATEPSTP
jgi:MFS family permease